MNAVVLIRPASAALDALDAARGVLLRLAARTYGLRCIVTNRDARLAAQSLLSVVLLAIATLQVPGLLLLVGPALFGVAHVISDVRHLVIRRDVPRAWVRLVAVASGLLIALRVVELAVPTALPFARIEMIAGWSWVAASVGLGGRAGRVAGRWVPWTAFVIAMGAASVCTPALARWVFAFAHNLVALVVWVVLFRSRKLVALPAIAAALMVAALLASGALLPWARFGTVAGRQVMASVAVDGRIDPNTAMGIGLSYVFLQALHYAAWLSWIPQDDLRGGGTTTFRMTARTLRRELGGTGCLLALGAAIAVAVASIVRAQPTRAVYLSVASFHGWLELAALAFFVARGPLSARGARAAA